MLSHSGTISQVAQFQVNFCIFSLIWVPFFLTVFFFWRTVGAFFFFFFFFFFCECSFSFVVSQLGSSETDIIKGILDRVLQQLVTPLWIYPRLADFSWQYLLASLKLSMLSAFILSTAQNSWPSGSPSLYYLNSPFWYPSPGRTVIYLSVSLDIVISLCEGMLPVTLLTPFGLEAQPS